MLFNVIPLHTKLRFDGQFSVCQPERFTRSSQDNTTCLAEYRAGLNNSHPVFGRTRTFTPPNFGRLLCHGLVRKSSDPYLTFPLPGALHGYTCSFTATGRNPPAIPG